MSHAVVIKAASLIDFCCTVLMMLYVSPHQKSPLSEAASIGNIDILRYLADKGADVNIKNDSGVSECVYF